MPTVKEIIEKFEMEPLTPEGGYIKAVHFSDIVLKKESLPERYTCDKPLYGTILYLITKDSFSKMHYLPTDEIYHFYMGDPVEQLQLFPDGSGRIVRLGPDILNGEAVQSVVPACSWHGSRLAPRGEYALLGTTMAPGYTDSDYVHGDAAYLVGKYPRFKREILDRL
jgi:predicted cupin superfamily sugar epimerase